ncbi:MAG TPA: alpha/beta hydrolase [Chloroflexota bacterium]|nr:alpha/beta hydrolase [Chloroflexota bacterium]
MVTVASSPLAPPRGLPPGVSSRFVMAGGIRTHYLEAGRGEPVVLLHSAEFGGRAELSWRYNIAALAERFHVCAPDMAGFGRTEKVFNFSDRNGFRVRHVRAFMKALCIDSAHFVGNSFGGSILQTIAAQHPSGAPKWIRSIVSVSGGGFAPDNDARKVLTHYDGSREGMRAILRVMFWDERWWSEEHVEERWRASIEPGAWEAVAAARLAVPGQEKGFGSERGDPGNIKVPVLVVGGDRELLREPGCWEDLHRRIPNAELKIFSPARHCPHIEFADEFNRLAVEFLSRVS